MPSARSKIAKRTIFISLNNNELFAFLLFSKARQQNNRYNMQMTGKIDETNLLDDLRVLIVDDNSVVRGTLRCLLSCFGCADVYEASSPDCARDILSQHRIDIMITDWLMPEEDGLSLINSLQDDFSNRRNPEKIIILTANQESKKIAQARKLQIDGFLAKPFTPHQLYDVLTTTICLQNSGKRTSLFVNSGQYLVRAMPAQR